MNSATLAAASSVASSSAIAVVRRSRVNSLDGLASRTLLRTGSASNALKQRRSTTTSSVSAMQRSSAAGKANTTAALAESRRLFRSRSMISQPSRAFSSHTSTPLPGAAATRLTRRLGAQQENGGGSFGGRRGAGPASGASQGDKRRLATAAGAAVAASIAVVATQSGDGADHVGGGSLVWCREEQGQREDGGSPFVCRPGRGAGAAASAASSSAAVEDDTFCPASTSTTARIGIDSLGGRIFADASLIDAPPAGKVSGSSFVSTAGQDATTMLDHSNNTSRLDHTSDDHEFGSFRGFDQDIRDSFNRTERVAATATAATVRATQEDESVAVESITDVYRFESGGQPVGRGQRSVVSSATHRLTGQPVAVKRISRTTTSRLEVMEEVQMLEMAGAHPNVVTLQAFFEDQEAYYIVMDLCQGGELYHRLADKGRYSEGQAARIMAEVAEAVGYLHSCGIVHFDLKPENIMLVVGDDCVPEVRLADFGSAFRQHRPLSGAKDCTVAYSAPEVLACQDVDEKVDMWALGVVMWVLLTGRHPFDTSVDLSEEEVARKVANEEPDLRSRGIRHVSPEGKDLVRKLLAKDPEDRPSARQMLNHPWFRAVMSRSRMPLRKAGARTHATTTTAGRRSASSSSFSSSFIA